MHYCLCPDVPPVWDLVPPPVTIKGILGNRCDQVTPLPKTSWRLPITLTINFQFLNMAYKVVHDLARTLLPSPHLKPSPTLVVPALLSLQVSARHRLLWEDRLSPPRSENSPSPPCPTTSPLSLALHTHCFFMEYEFC